MSSRRQSRKKSSGGSIATSSRRKSKSVQLEQPVEEKPKYPYFVDNETPISDLPPDMDKLEEPLSIKESHVLNHSLEVSRNQWLSGSMFEKYWSRPPRGRKLGEGEVNAREKMTKLCECTMVIGPHFFGVKLFICKDEHGEPKEDPEEKLRKAAEEQQRQYEEAKRQAQEEAERRAREEREQFEREKKEREETERKEREEAERKAKEEAELKSKQEVESQQGSPSASSSSTTSASAAKQTSVSTSISKPGPKVNQQPPPHEVVVKRLQTMANNDAALSALMSVVATGKASAEQLEAFQIYIKRAKNTNIVVDGPSNKAKPKPKPKPKVVKAPAPKPPKPPKPVKVPKPPPPPKKTKGTYNSKKNMKDVMVVFEFKDNPADRYILPRESIVEVLPNNVILVSYLHVHNKQELKKELEEKGPSNGSEANKSAADSTPAAAPAPAKPKATRKTRRSAKMEAQENATKEEEQAEAAAKGAERAQQEAKVVPQFTAMTLVLREVPRKSVTMVERSVTKEEIVYKRMEETLAKGERTKDYYVWYQIDKSDTELFDVVQQPAKPPPNMIFPARKREYKPRPKKPGEAKRRKKSGAADTGEQKEDSEAAEGDATQEAGVSVKEEEEDHGGNGNAATETADANTTQDQQQDVAMGESNPDMTQDQQQDVTMEEDNAPTPPHEQVPEAEHSFDLPEPSHGDVSLTL